VSTERAKQEAAAGLDIRQMPVAETRELRQAVLRPHESLEYLAEHEPDDAFALGVFEEDRLIAVGFIGRDGEVEAREPRAWRVRGMATLSEARGRGAGGAILAGLIDHGRRERRDACLVQCARFGAGVLRAWRAPGCL